MSEPGTVGGLVRLWAARFLDAGIDTPVLDARVLMGEAAAMTPLEVLTRADRQIDAAAALKFDIMAKRRLAGEPVARILRRREFWSLDFHLAPTSLVPRPDSENVILAALDFFPGGAHRALRLLDLGTGPGTLLLPLLREWPLAFGVGIDQDAATLSCARENARRFGVEGRACFVRGDWGDALANGAFDLIVANPPYIRSGEIPKLEVGVREHDPMAALDGGEDGLDAYRAIMPQLCRLLRPGGMALLEIGEDQEEAVSGLAVKYGLPVEGRARRDLAGHPRVVSVSGPIMPR